MKSLLPCALLSVCTSTAFADTIYISPGESIQAGINSANNGDVISIAAGTFVEYNINTLGKEITLLGQTNGKGVATTTIDGNWQDVVLVCENGETQYTVLENLIITGGQATDDFMGGPGGMKITYSSPTLINCTFVNNHTKAGDDWGMGGEGGGIYCAYSNPTLTNCTFTNNVADSNGGGIYNFESDLTLTNCTFSNNTSGYLAGGIMNMNNSTPTITNCTFDANSAFQGGAIFNCCGSHATIVESVFTSNTAYNGGAIVNENSNPEITHCQFDSNSASDGGGAIENETNAQPTFTDCTFTNNAAANRGGAMFSHLNSTTTIVSCSFSSNTSGGYGGALFLIDYCSINISNSTITTNTAIDGGAVYVLDTSFATIDNCTICGNSTPQMVGWNSTEPNCVTDDCANCDDADGDGYPDVFDGCPNDPNKTEPGVCGCGVADVDSDGDTILDCNDAFPSDPSEWVDSDGDGVGDNEDNTFGGCCVTNGCIPTNDPDCTALGGSWLGEDENCENCTSSCVGDINADGTVGVDDLLSMIAAWGACP